MMLGRLMVWLVAQALVFIGLGIALDQPYAPTKPLIGFVMMLLGGYLFTRLIYVAQREKGIDTWH